MYLPKNKVIQGNNAHIMKNWPANSIDMILSSPPYDPTIFDEDGNLITLWNRKTNVRNYFGYEWSFTETADQAVRVLKPGGCLVWIVNDTALEPGRKCGSSVRQSEYFQRRGLWLFDTLFWETDAQPTNDGRYRNDVSYMFVLSKGRLKYHNPIKVPSKHAGKKRTQTYRRRSGELEKVWVEKSKTYNKEKPASKIWYFPTNQNGTEEKYTLKNGGTFPEALALAHIQSWAAPGYIIADIFAGSGTTPKMAELTGHDWIAVDIARENCEMIERRIAETIAKGEGAAIPSIPLRLTEEEAAQADQPTLFDFFT